MLSPSSFWIGSGLLEFGEFCQLAAKFLVEEDEEALKKELKEAFRIYDKEGEKSLHLSRLFDPLRGMDHFEEDDSGLWYFCK